MAEKPAPKRKLTDKNTKQEMLEAFESLAKQLDEKRAEELNADKRAEEKKKTRGPQGRRIRGG